MRDESSWIGDVLSPEDASRAVGALAKEVMALGVAEYGNKKAATAEISRRFGLGGWFLKVFHGERATYHLHLYCRLCAALEDLNERQRRRVEHNERIIRELRNRNAASAGIRGLRHTVGSERGATL